MSRFYLSYINRFIIQYAAYPTPNPNDSMIQGLQNGVSLNFQAKIPTESTAKITPMILGSIFF
jgi:hypothetical protein